MSGFEKVVVTGKSHDGGIDGYGTLEINPFVSFKVLFQCKRYKRTVARAQVGDFRNAMIGRAEKYWLNSPQAMIPLQPLHRRS